MAKKIVHELIDDVNGKPADVTIHFSVAGRDYTLDLTLANADAFNASIGPWIEKAQKATGARKIPRQADSPETSAAKREHNQAIRDWAAREGIYVSTRGRVDGRLVEMYNTLAQGKELSPRDLTYLERLKEARPMNPPSAVVVAVPEPEPEPEPVKRAPRKRAAKTAAAK